MATNTIKLPSPKSCSITTLYPAKRRSRKFSERVAWRPMRGESLGAPHRGHLVLRPAARSGALNLPEQLEHTTEMDIGLPRFLDDSVRPVGAGLLPRRG